MSAKYSTEPTTSNCCINKSLFCFSSLESSPTHIQHLFLWNHLSLSLRLYLLNNLPHPQHLPPFPPQFPISSLQGHPPPGHYLLPASINFRHVSTKTAHKEETPKWTLAWPAGKVFDGVKWNYIVVVCLSWPVHVPFSQNVDVLIPVRHFSAHAVRGRPTERGDGCRGEQKATGRWLMTATQRHYCLVKEVVSYIRLLLHWPATEPR